MVGGGKNDAFATFDGRSTRLDAGNPPLAIEDTAGCSLSLLATVRPTSGFIRCDANADGVSNIADSVWMINAIFRSGPRTECSEAADCNADDMTDISDAIFLL